MVIILQGIFDSHAHYDDKAFNDDATEILNELENSGIDGVINVGSNMKSSESSVLLSQKYNFIYCAVGIHPHDAINAEINWQDRLRKLLNLPKTVALGEIGLDFHYDYSPRDIQRDIFIEQLKIAKELDKPVIIHSREACAETVNILKQEKIEKGVVHCFSGSAETAREYLKMGLYIGFTGVITFKNARKSVEVIESLPLDKLLIETDCPYMAPEPFRGKRCDSTMIIKTAEKMAQIKGITTKELIDITRNNAKTLFNIK